MRVRLAEQRAARASAHLVGKGTPYSALERYWANVSLVRRSFNMLQLVNDGGSRHPAHGYTEAQVEELLLDDYGPSHGCQVPPPPLVPRPPSDRTTRFHT